MEGRSALAHLLRDASDADPARRNAAYAEISRLLLIFVRASMGRKVRDHRESLDICQSVAKSFVEDFQAGKVVFDSEAAIAGYLRQVVRTKLADFARTDGAIKRGGPQSRPEASASDHPAHDPSASTKAASREEYERAVAELSEEDQILFRLRARDLSWEQIAAQMGADPAALRQRWSRLRSRLGDRE